MSQAIRTHCGTMKVNDRKIPFTKNNQLCMDLDQVDFSTSSHIASLDIDDTSLVEEFSTGTVDYCGTRGSVSRDKRSQCSATIAVILISCQSDAQQKSM